MTTPNANDATESFTGLDQVIAQYLQAVEAGQVPNRHELLERHPELADALRAFFADFDRVDLHAAPLRLAGDADCLLSSASANATGPGVLATVRYFGDYELLEEIARGGMGVVYKARQASLNRIVALKMILKGVLATPVDVARFRAEAESAAALDHPHIVPIHEVGEHEGQQYFAMRYVEGTTLARAPRQLARAEVARLLDVARAVHFAHQRGILHRDLKPSNVLIDPAGSAFVTDFGLAKRTGADSSLTETGQPVGTPRYMAPEQAAGHKDVTVGVDVYSLGVILYERLTGRPPFRGDNMLEVLRQVRETDPPRPSSILPGLDRDLETICLKCLEKDPGRRYASAETLADDLDRWLKGEPIAARPVGRLERAWLWSRRNPALATAGGLTVAALVAVAVTSSIAAFQAQARAKAERRERDVARQAEQDAVAAREAVERALARNFVGPLDVDLAAGEGGGGLSTTEANALWQLAENPGERIWLHFLDEATRHPFSVHQLYARREPAMIAALGLDCAKKDQASRLLTARIVDSKMPLKQRTEVALVALELEHQSSPTRSAYTEIVAAALDGNRSVPDSESLCNLLLLKTLERFGPFAADQEPASRIEARLQEVWPLSLAEIAGGWNPHDAARICGPIARARARALETEVNAANRTSQASDLSLLAPRMEPEEAVPLLIRALEKEPSGSGYFGAPDIAWALVSVAGRMEPANAARMLASVLEKSKYDNVKEELALGVSSVAGRMEPGAAAKVCDPLARMLAKELARELANNKDSPLDMAMAMGTGVGAVEFLASGLAALASRLDPTEAAEVCGPVARALSTTIERNPGIGSMKGLALLLKLTEPAEARKLSGRVARTWAGLLKEETPSNISQLTLIADWLDPIAAADLFDRAGRALSVVLEKAADPSTSSKLALELEVVATVMKPSDGARVLMAHVRGSREWSSRLLSLARRMTASAGEELCTEAIRRLLKQRGPPPPEIAFLLRKIKRGKARGIAIELARLMGSERDVDSASSSFGGGGETVLDAALSDSDRLPVFGFSLLARERGEWKDPMKSDKSPPCRLTTQELVELLKTPTCIGKARRVVLDHLGNIHGRRFTNHWEFVRFAREKGLQLDLTTPPRRPDPQESIKRMLAILDRVS